MNTGGPAFPSADFEQHEYTGMTLRDWFAGQAMTTMFYPAIMESIRTDVDLNCDKVAEFAYLMADAMLSQREKS